MKNGGSLQRIQPREQVSARVCRLVAESRGRPGVTKNSNGVSAAFIPMRNYFRKMWPSAFGRLPAEKWNSIRHAHVACDASTRSCRSNEELCEIGDSRSRPTTVDVVLRTYASFRCIRRVVLFRDFQARG